jgi:DNA-directed RNA polymerase subunit beta'
MTKSKGDKSMADITAIKALKIGIASPEDIQKWSFGEVKKPETINYRTFKPERDGLFCERIFGPTKDWECSCGRYKKVKFKGVRCERCGVEVTRARVRRERMGHIELAAPVCHIWYLRGQPPSPLGLLLDMSPRLLEKVIYFTSYIIIDVDRVKLNGELESIRGVLLEEKESLEEDGERICQELDAELERELEENTETYTDQQKAERVKANENRKQLEKKERTQQVEEMEKAYEVLVALQRFQLLDEANWSAVEHLLLLASRRLQRDLRILVEAGLGAAAIRKLLQQIDLEKLARELRQEIVQTQGPRRARAIKRLEIVEAFLQSKTRPEWMIMEVLPVLPPELRPMVQLDGGRFATSDLNDLYRRIINRNNRLKRIIEIRAPGSIVNHEKRLLQESVDALIDNTRKPKPVPGSHNRPLKSLSDMLKGKEGRFRKNLLGKRVDYSGRSVIVVGPHLKLHQCGLPKEIALELFKPFVMHELTESGDAQNIKNAKRLIDRQKPEVWRALETVIKEHPVLLNRAPTLHRLGIQAFEPILVEGKAIQIHPLVCHAYNADFDGDQMAVHVPLSFAAQAEARVLMLSTHNLFSPADGRPIVAPLQDIVLGAYYLTMPDPTQAIHQKPGVETSLMFSSPEEALYAYEMAHIGLHTRIQVRVPFAESETGSKVEETTLGRLLFNAILPESLRYQSGYLNETYNKKKLSVLIRDIYNLCGRSETVRFLDDLKAIGFLWASRGGITIAVSDLESPPERHDILDGTMNSVRQAQLAFENGEMSGIERRREVIRQWQEAYEKVAEAIKRHIGRLNPLYVITDSGARGSDKQLTQLAGMRGLMTDPFGNFIEDLPILHNFHEGLSVFEYFVSTHGARKGLADTALRTADAGYLTRRLVDIAQDVIIRIRDCGTTEGISVCRIDREGEMLESLSDRIHGRYPLHQLKHPYTGELWLVEHEMITPTQAKEIDRLAQKLETFTQSLRSLPEKLHEGELLEGDIVDPQTDKVLLAAYADVTEKSVQKLRKRKDELQRLWEKAGFEWIEHDMIGVPIRSPLSCISRQGICAACYGIDLATQRAVEMGTAVGIVAAQSIGEPGTQLTMRTFHTGGIAGEDSVGVKDVKRQRSAALREIMSVQEPGKTATATFTGEEMRDLRTEQQRILQQVARDLTGKDPVLDKIEIDPAKIHIVGEEVTLIGAPEGESPTAEKLKETEEKLRRIVKNWTQKLVKLLENEIGGIARVEELFEARKPKGEAIIAEYEAEVVDIKTAQRGRWVILRATLSANEQLAGKLSLHAVTHPETGDVIVREVEEITTALLNRLVNAGVEHVDCLDLVLVPYRGGLEVKPGDTVRPGDRITPGPLHPDKLLKLRGVRGVQDYLVREIQAVYKSQGVDINDKHIEVVVRQMLKKRRVKDPGDTSFLPGQIADRFILEDENERVMNRDEPGRPATADWVLLGISEASLQTESFLSAASFQKTTRVLTEAAVKGKIDDLVGLKENVIIGRLIPAGTGFSEYAHVDVLVERRRGPSLELMEPHTATELIETNGAGQDKDQSSLDFEVMEADVVDGNEGVDRVEGPDLSEQSEIHNPEKPEVEPPADKEKPKATRKRKKAESEG